ncbi:MAG TPA: GspH/FimT family protein [Longimicrobium sp.]|jgi:prepilin-type N-terminal cleavage/methylation domain-containing protein
MSTPSLQSTSSRQGFSLVELLAVLVVIGVLTALMAPRMDGALNGVRVTRLLDRFASDVSLARMQAIRRGGTAAVTISGGNQYLVTVSRGTTARLDTLKRVSTSSDYPGVKFVKNGNLTFDSRGLLTPASTLTSVVAVQAARRDSIIITGIGQVYRGY